MEASTEYLLFNRALHAVCEFVDDTVQYSTLDVFEKRRRPKSVQLPMKTVKTKHFRAISHQPPKVFSPQSKIHIPIRHRRILQKRVAWKKIRHITARIDCWNRNYHRPPLKRGRLKSRNAFYDPKPYDTWNEDLPPNMDLSISNRIRYVEAKPKVDTWLKKPYIPSQSKIKIFHKPVEIQGKSRVDTWLKLSSRPRSANARV